MHRILISLFLFSTVLGCSSPQQSPPAQRSTAVAPGKDPYLDLYREVIRERDRSALVKPAPATNSARQDLVWALMGSILSVPDMGDRPASETMRSTLEGRNLNLLDHVRGTHDRRMLVLALINANLAASDPHAQYLPPAAVSTLDQRLRLFDEGLGIEIMETIPDKVVVSSIAEASPAAKQKGLIVGSVLRRLRADQGLWYHPENEAAWRVALSGPPGTSVGLEWVDLEGGMHSATLKRTWWSIENQRTRVKITEGSAGRLALVSIPAFYDRNKEIGTVPDLDVALSIARVRSAEILVLDFRGNRGGEWRTVMDTASRIMPGGLMVNALNASLPRPLPVRIDSYDKAWLGPVWVWVDRNTASGGEILAGSLRENVGACIIGERTFGKATMQERIDIKSSPGGQLLVSTTMYVWPSGKTAQWTGVEPDVWMSHPSEHDNLGERAYPSSMAPFSKDVSTVATIYAGSVVDDADWIKASIGFPQCNRP